VNQQSLSGVAPDVQQQFRHSLSLASSSSSDQQRRDALSYLTNQLSAETAVNPVGTTEILSKLLPAISHTSSPVRSQLLELFRSLPEKDVKQSVDPAIMHIRAGMTHLSADISNDALSVMDWLLDAAGEELVCRPGGWVRPLKTFSVLLGWRSSGTDGGWTPSAQVLSRSKDSATYSRKISVVTKLLHTGLKSPPPVQEQSARPLDHLYRLPRDPHAFDYLNLSGPPRNEEEEMYGSREERQTVFNRVFLEQFSKGTDEAQKLGGPAGRAAVKLRGVIEEEMADFEDSAAVSAQDLLDLW
jgi:pre-rRNA-processing protein IPI1